MKIVIAHDKKIIKKETKKVESSAKTVNKSKVKSKVKSSANTVSALSLDIPKPVSTVEVETNVLAINDYGVFMVKSGKTIEPVEGRIIEISNESTDKDSLLIFRVDISTEYSALVDVVSDDILNWTKSGEETIDIKDLLKYSYEDEKSLVITTESSTIVVRVNDIVEVTNIRTGDVKTGRISSILTNQVTIDCSTKGYSDVYVIDNADLEVDNITLKVVNK